MCLGIINESSSYLLTVQWFLKISIPTPQKVTGNSKGEGVSTAKIYKGKYEAKLEIPEGVRGFK